MSSDVDSQHLQDGILAAEFQAGKASTTRLEVARGSPASPDMDVLAYATEMGKLLADFGQPSGGGSEEPLSSGGAHEVCFFSTVVASGRPLINELYLLNESQAAESEHRVLGPGDLASHIRETDVAVERSSKRIRSSSVGSEEVTIAQRLEVPTKEPPTEKPANLCVALCRLFARSVCFVLF